MRHRIPQLDVHPQSFYLTELLKRGCRKGLSHEYREVLRQEMHRENLNVNDTRTKTKVLW